MTVSDGMGTVDVLAHRVPALPPLVESLRIALATGQLRRPLRETLGPLLRLLTSGRYELAGPEPLYDDRRLIATTAWPPPDDGRVGYYRRAVRSGLRPVAVLAHAEGRRGAYVLDGHRKIAAYQAERLAPSVIRIRAVSRGSGPTARSGAALRRPNATR